MPTITYLIPVYRAGKARDKKNPSRILGKGKPVGMPAARASKLMQMHPLDWEFDHEEEEQVQSGKLQPWEEADGEAPVRAVDVAERRDWKMLETPDPKDTFVVDGGPDGPVQAEAGQGKGRK